ncbi:hypothetical protein QAD02_002290 [Eretmocerus hayati]|uniref:Uncharacterized protein n=1 Tax=Eretmocerus hayati TaxID=131215 RepID=A0ACC2NIU8_9HYME|nr:hypothetical protein QAD02_002290 [Eretmocerus hayati]
MVAAPNERCNDADKPHQLTPVNKQHQSVCDRIGINTTVIAPPISPRSREWLAGKAQEIGRQEPTKKTLMDLPSINRLQIHVLKQTRKLKRIQVFDEARAWSRSEQSLSSSKPLDTVANDIPPCIISTERMIPPTLEQAETTFEEKEEEPKTSMGDFNSKKWQKEWSAAKELAKRGCADKLLNLLRAQLEAD